VDDGNSKKVNYRYMIQSIAKGISEKNRSRGKVLEKVKQIVEDGQGPRLKESH
jgi:hypothetical protein